MQPKRGKLSAPHFGPPVSYTRIPDQSPGYYSSPGNRRRTCGHGDTNNRRRAGSIRKAEESSRKNLQAKNPENSGVGTVALFITESLKHRKVYPVPLDPGNLPALDLRVVKWQVATPSHKCPSCVPGKVDTPKPRLLRRAHACPDEIKFGCAQQAVACIVCGVGSACCRPAVPAQWGSVALVEEFSTPGA
ncbi:hypothetical protein CDL15_Pgr021189 [Punica granatum]|uniref:Uncharacterized protein n=1 Tax=Punica granatum TaxID=22663 RepID=A0A218WVE0_PUNGR|nr:hypothetical protein CDL15_Pgr021189 [Punica granatum]